MILKRLKLHKAIGLQIGSNVETVDLDFSNIQGIVAIVGTNGSGKTTLLENMQPYLTIPGQSRTISDGFEPGGERILIFSFGAHELESTVRVAKTKTTAFLKVDGVEKNPSGNQKSYTAELEKVLGPANVFFQTVFCSQRAFRLVGLRRGKRQELFYKLNRLDHYLEKNKLAKEKLVALQVEYDQMTQRQQSYEVDLQTQLPYGTTFSPEIFKQLIAELEQTKLAKTQELEACTAEIKTTSDLIAQLRSTVAVLNQKETEHIKWQQTKDSLVEKVRKLEDAAPELKELVREKNIDEAINALEASHSKLETAIVEQAEKVSWKQKEYEVVIAQLTALKQTGAEIQRVTRQLTEAQAHLQTQPSAPETLSAQINEANSNVRSILLLEDQIAKTAIEIEQHKNSNSQLTQTIVSVENSYKQLLQSTPKSIQDYEQAKLYADSIISGVPCKEIELVSPMYERCPAYAKLNISAAKLNELELASKDDAKRQKEAVSAAATELTRLQGLIDQHRVDETTLYSRLLELKAEVERIQLNKNGVSWKTEFTNLVAQQERLQSQANEYIEARVKVAEYETKLQNLEDTSGYSANITRLENQADAIKTQVESLITVHANIEQDLSLTNTKLENLAELVRARDALKQVAQTLEESYQALAQLENARPELYNKQELLSAGSALTNQVYQLDAILQPRSSQLNIAQGVLNEKIRQLQATDETVQLAPFYTAEWRANIAATERQISEWRIIEQATAPGQMPAAELELLGISIEQWTNRLLNNLNPDNINVILETRREASEEGKEIDALDFRIIRPGLPSCLIEDLSDSQKAWVEEAVIEAALICQNTGSTSSFLTSFTDETGATMTPDNAQAFLDFKQRAMEMSGRTHRFMVMQNPAIYSQVPHKIVVDQTQHSVYIEG